MSQFISLEATSRTLNFSQTLQAELASFLSSNHANITQTARCSSFDKSLVAPPPNQPSKCNAPPNQTKPNRYERRATQLHVRLACLSDNRLPLFPSQPHFSPSATRFRLTTTAGSTTAHSSLHRLPTVGIR